jgi:hypothetical protein
VWVVGLQSQLKENSSYFCPFVPSPFVSDFSSCGWPVFSAVLIDFLLHCFKSFEPFGQAILFELLFR